MKHLLHQLFRHSAQLRRFPARMAADDHVLGVDDNRLAKAEFLARRVHTLLLPAVVLRGVGSFPAAQLADLDRAVQL